MSITKSGSYHYGKGTTGVERNPLTSVKHRVAYYENNTGSTVAQISVSDLSGDSLEWNTQNYTQLHVYKNDGTRLFPRMPGITNWQVDLTLYPYISFSPALNHGEAIVIEAFNVVQSLIRPAAQAQAGRRFTIAAGDTTTKTFTVSRTPLPLSFKSGVESKHYNLYVAGYQVDLCDQNSLLNDGTYVEVDRGDGTFTQITFRDAPGDALQAVYVECKADSLFESGNLDLAAVLDHGDRIANLESPTLNLFEFSISSTRGGSSSGETSVRNFTNSSLNGTAMTYTARTTTTGDKVTINTTGIYHITLSVDLVTTGPQNAAVIKNTTSYTPPILTSNSDFIMYLSTNEAAGRVRMGSRVMRLLAGDVVRVMSDTSDALTNHFFSIYKMPTPL